MRCEQLHFLFRFLTCELTTFSSLGPFNISAPAIHVLAVLCALSGLILAFVFVLHERERQPLFLVDRPGTTIGAVSAMLSPGSSGGQFSIQQQPNSFVGLLRPWDTNDEVEAKLKNVRFGLNPSTGAVEIQHDVGVETHAARSSSLLSPSFAPSKPSEESRQPTNASGQPAFPPGN